MRNSRKGAKTQRKRAVGKLLVLNLLILVLSIIWWEPKRPVRVAVAKGVPHVGLSELPKVRLDETWVRAVAMADAELAAVAAEKEATFVNALRLSRGEARPWQTAGCGEANCVHLTYYNHQEGGSLEAVVNLDTNTVVDHWTNALARPGGSPFIAEKAVAIAADDASVQVVLGDIHRLEPAMAPMSGWLLDDACADEWCVDLTFHDPAGSGRIFHVFVNMEREQVARTFYTRGREPITVAKPPEQRFAYTDGCIEQQGWNVCWEMTAHDGVNFRDATYNDHLIFSSIKIGQIEAWYPSWPGGYRDEVGFAASVRPFGETAVVNLDHAFEVRQLFTEFTHWPNCICCYRYEQIIRFYADGSFEPRFVSHGPGCDDLSLYRPFWRIDLDLDGPDGDQIWLWQTTEWVEATTAFELHPFVDNDLSLEGHKLATFDSTSDVHYRWAMEPTDPLGLDEAHLFALRDKEDQGGGPILTGPGDTYQPPRQWLDTSEPLSGEDIVLWFVPSLKTKKGGPWWCMPDPEPGINQCTAILRAEPAGELRQPTAEELEQLSNRITVRPERTETPTATVATGATPTPRPIQGETAEEIVLNSGCGACHAIGALGEEGKVGPDLTAIGAVAAGRVPTMTAAAYIRQSILAPNATIAPQCPNSDCLPDIMPQDYSTRLTDEQVETLVAFLLAQTGKTTMPTPPAIGANATAVPKAFPSPKRAPGSPENGRGGVAVQLSLVSLVLLLSLFRILKAPPKADASP